MTIEIPFPDFDYLAMAAACGCTARLQGRILTVSGSHAALLTFCNDLGYDPFTQRWI